MKERYEFEITTVVNGKERKRVSKRYACNQSEAEEGLRKSTKLEITKMKLIIKEPTKEPLVNSEIVSNVKNCAICKNPAFKKGWCINHYVKIFNSQD